MAPNCQLELRRWAKKVKKYPPYAHLVPTWH